MPCSPLQHCYMPRCLLFLRNSVAANCSRRTERIRKFSDYDVGRKTGYRDMLSCSSLVTPQSFGDSAKKER